MNAADPDLDGTDMPIIQCAACADLIVSWAVIRDVDHSAIHVCGVCFNKWITMQHRLRKAFV